MAIAKSRTRVKFTGYVNVPKGANLPTGAGIKRMLSSWAKLYDDGTWGSIGDVTVSSTSRSAASTRRTATR